MHPEITNSLSLISAARTQDEAACIANLNDAFSRTNYNHQAASNIARNYIQKFRNDAGNIGLEEFFRQYPLDTKEGLAVMSLAEALLRIPDTQTANLLIHDKLGSASWQQRGKSTSSIVKASSLGIKLAAKLMELGKAVSLVVDPVVRESMRQSMQILGDHFVLGEDTKAAVKKGTQYQEQGYTLSYDMLGEGARNNDQATQYMQNYMRGITQVALSADKNKSLFERPGISVKLSALYPKYKLLNKEKVFAQLLPKLKEIVLWAKASGIAVTIDAEEASRLDLSLELFAKLVSDKDLNGFNGIGLAVQAYNKSAPYVIDFICTLAKLYNRQIPTRLVKGAYWDAEIKAAQIAGIAAFPVFTRKEYSDLSYLVCAHKMLENSDLIYPQFATHNAFTIAAIEVMAGKGRNFEFQKLYGMGNGIHDQIIGRYKSRIYAPVGLHSELLPYLIRRILENGASTSFLKKVIDVDVEVDELTPDLTNTKSSIFNLQSSILLPENLYAPDRKNSLGFDLGNEQHVQLLQREIARFQGKKGKVSPIINGREIHKFAHLVEEEGAPICAPYDTKTRIGTVWESKVEDIDVAIASTYSGFAKWSKNSATARAEIIEKFADLLEENRFEIMALCMMEAGKTIADVIAELREAVDFCRYYAARSRELFVPKNMLGPTGEANVLSMHGRGVFLCISPWNFPLAIFTGQIVAALVAGNTVIAKPAEQTPLIAGFAIKLLLKAGLPKDAISLLPGDGAAIGKTLLLDKRISGVAFTGSGETANIIAQSLANRGGAIVPFIAETGGINAMIIDSSAHMEQAVDDIILSSFGSAGQRCSALRVLYVQEEIADALFETLKGAMEILQVGNPDAFATDVGPVIDAESYKKLSNYISEAKLKFKVLASAPAQTISQAPDAYFIAPIAFEINSIADLPGEIFGPVLHIIRYRAKDFEKIIKQINNSGYGLTIGLQTRITSRVEYLRENAAIGNIYINRTMIGATVGVQPFGGEGLSGTGPKAGGPHYLLKFTTERAFSENTAAIGGNRELLV